jgi:hypothetical protein
LLLSVFQVLAFLTLCSQAPSFLSPGWQTKFHKKLSAVKGKNILYILICRFKTEDWKINNYDPDGSKHSETKKKIEK